MNFMVCPSPGAKARVLPDLGGILEGGILCLGSQ